MTGYPFIKDLFTNVLAKSRSIGGRFFICPKFGIEINSETLGQVLNDTVTQITGAQKYPLSLMMPPKARGPISSKQGGFKDYLITMFFLKTTYYEGGQIQNVNPNTQTSLHTIDQDWHDMQRAAEGFIRVLDSVQRINKSLLMYFRLDTSDVLITPVSHIGSDRAAGVQVNFKAQIFSGCEIEDYDPADIPGIEIPPMDSHPNHY